MLTFFISLVVGFIVTFLILRWRDQQQEKREREQREKQERHAAIVRTLDEAAGIRRAPYYPDRARASRRFSSADQAPASQDMTPYYAMGMANATPTVESHAPSFRGHGGTFDGGGASSSWAPSSSSSSCSSDSSSSSSSSSSDSGSSSSSSCSTD